jgi:hypothetical protein
MLDGFHAACAIVSAAAQDHPITFSLWASAREENKISMGKLAFGELGPR